MLGPIECFCGCKCPIHKSVTTLITILVQGIFKVKESHNKLASMQDQLTRYRCSNLSHNGVSQLQGFKVTGFQGYKFRDFQETRIKVRVPSRIDIEILILEICLPEGLLSKGCGFDHLPHLHYQLKEILKILRQNYHWQCWYHLCGTWTTCMASPRGPIDFQG